MDNDEITNRLINVLKGGAYLIASSILGAAILITFPTVLSLSFGASWVQGLLLSIAFLGMLVSQYSYYRLARRLLDR